MNLRDRVKKLETAARSRRRGECPTCHGRPEADYHREEDGQVHALRLAGPCPRCGRRDTILEVVCKTREQAAAALERAAKESS